MGVLEFLRLRMDVNRLRPDLQMATQRIDLIMSKKSNNVKSGKREIAKLLAESPPRVEEARIRVEHLIHEENAIEGLEIVKLNCKLCAQRLSQIKSSEYCPPDLLEAVSTILWASDKAEVEELVNVQKQFVIKYGKRMLLKARCNDNHCVNERAIKKLLFSPPSGTVIMQYLELIAEDAGVPWDPKEHNKENMDCDDTTTAVETIPARHNASEGNGNPNNENLERRVEALESKFSQQQMKTGSVLSPPPHVFIGEVVHQSHLQNDIPPPPYPGTTLSNVYIPEAPAVVVDGSSCTHPEPIITVHRPSQYGLSPIQEVSEGNFYASSIIHDPDLEHKDGDTAASLQERFEALKHGS